MVNINLLDWRARKRFVANNRYYVMLAAVVVCCGLLTASGNFVVIYMLHAGKKGLSTLDSEIMLIIDDIKKIEEIETKRNLIMDRRTAVQKLHANRKFLVKMWNDLAQSVPDGVVLNEISSEKGEVLLVGTGASNTQIAMLMKNVQEIPWVQEAKLGELKSSGANSDIDNSQSIDFKLQIIIKPEDDVELKEEAVAASSSPVEGVEPSMVEGANEAQ